MNKAFPELSENCFAEFSSQYVKRWHSCWADMVRRAEIYLAGYGATKGTPVSGPPRTQNMAWRDSSIAYSPLCRSGVRSQRDWLSSAVKHPLLIWHDSGSPTCIVCIFVRQETELLLLSMFITLCHRVVR